MAKLRTNEMPVDLASPFKQRLKEIVTISNGIRNSALDHANGQNFDVSEKCRRQLETIRVSADTILETFAKAALTTNTLDDRIIDWLVDGEPRVCLERLKEMEDMFKPAEQVQRDQSSPQLPIPTEDKLVAAMDFLSRHEGVFRFLLTWNNEKGIAHAVPPQTQAPQNVGKGGKSK